MRTVKLAEWIYRSLAARGNPPAKEISEEERTRINALLPPVTEPHSPEAVLRAAKRAEALAAAEGEKDWYVLCRASYIFFDAAFRLSHAPGPAATDRIRALGLAAFEYAARGIEKNPAYPELSANLAYAATALHDEDRNREAVKMIRAAMAKGLRPDPVLLTLLLGIGGAADEDPATISFLREQGLEIKKDRDRFRITAENYRSLAEAARARGMVYLAMQYPTGKTEAVKNIFSRKPVSGYRSFADSLYDDFPGQDILPEYRDIIFIGNENFNKLKSRNFLRARCPEVMR